MQTDKFQAISNGQATNALAKNLKIQEISNKGNNLLKNEKWGGGQNIKKYLAEAEGCTCEDAKKCKSTLASLNGTLNAANNILSAF